MALEHRSIARQLIYLTLALIALRALVSFLVRAPH